MENLIDPPLTEKDAHALHVFYEQFLRKDHHDSLSLLKSVTLVRRADLRKYIHNFSLMRKRLDGVLRGSRHRNLLLSFPSTVQRVHQLVWEGQETYGAEGSTAINILGGQAAEYLDETEMFRIDLDTLLSDCPSILPEDKAALADSIAAGYGEHLFLLIALADHIFFTLLPYGHARPTEAVLRTHAFVQERFGQKFEDQIIEFFVIGGGHARVAGDLMVLCGIHPVFDPIFAEFGKPESDRLMGEFLRAKFELASAALLAEMPHQRVAVQV
jgi:hypothetical protein